MEQIHWVPLSYVSLQSFEDRKTPLFFLSLQRYLIQFKHNWLSYKLQHILPRYFVYMRSSPDRHRLVKIDSYQVGRGIRR